MAQGPDEVAGCLRATSSCAARTRGRLALLPRRLFDGATSAYQIEGGWNEGGKGNNTWDVFCHENPDEVVCANVADDFYHRYKDDVSLMAQDGHSSFRFSISWPRVMMWNNDTKRMVADGDGIAYYHSLMDDLLANGIEPVVTLIHWDMPYELTTELEQVGWVDPTTIEHFAQFGELMFLEFGKKAKYWATFNEPLSFVSSAYGMGYGPPALVGEAYTAAHHVLLAHGVAVQRFRELKVAEIIRSDARIGIVLNYDNVYPLNASDPIDIAAAERKFAFDFGWWAEPLTTGDYPAIMRQRVGSALPNFTETEAALVKGSYDLFMLNHYSSFNVTDCSSATSTTNCSDLAEGWPRDRDIDASWYPVGTRWAGTGNAKCSGFNGYPQGYRDTLNLVHAYDRSADILLTENGWCGNETIDNQDQLWYLQTHLEQVYKAMTEDYIPIIGYHVWSMLDNYEWGNYQQRYGLYYVNFTEHTGNANEVTPDAAALQRIPRTAATWYAQTATSKCIADEL